MNAAGEPSDPLSVSETQTTRRLRCNQTASLTAASWPATVGPRRHSPCHLPAAAGAATKADGYQSLDLQREPFSRPRPVQRARSRGESRGQSAGLSPPGPRMNWLTAPPPVVTRAA